MFVHSWQKVLAQHCLRVHAACCYSLRSYHWVSKPWFVFRSCCLLGFPELRVQPQQSTHRQCTLWQSLTYTCNINIQLLLLLLLAALVFHPNPCGEDAPCVSQRSTQTNFSSPFVWESSLWAAFIQRPALVRIQSESIITLQAPTVPVKSPFTAAGRQPYSTTHSCYNVCNCCSLTFSGGKSLPKVIWFSCNNLLIFGCIHFFFFLQMWK